MKRYRIYNERFIDLEDDEDIESHLESIIESMRNEDFEIERFLDQDDYDKVIEIGKIKKAFKAVFTKGVIVGEK